MKISQEDLFDDTVDNIMDSRTLNNMKDVLWNSYYNSYSGCTRNRCGNLKILLLNAPCNGFGDLIFAIKLRDYLSHWYDVEVTIATTFEKGLLSLGSDPKYVVGLVGGKSTQCRRFAGLKFNRKIPKQDLMFVAPMQIDFEPDLKDVQKLVPYANIWNTFTFSEYNDDLNKNFTFNTGVGKDRDGIFLTKFPKTRGKPKGLKNPYAMVYVGRFYR